MTSRRRFLQIASMGGACAAFSAAAEPVLGMIFPPLNYPVPPEARLLYPSGVRFLSAGVGLERMTPEGYDQVFDRIVPAAQKLAKALATPITALHPTKATLEFGCSIGVESGQLTALLVKGSANANLKVSLEWTHPA